MYSLMAGGLGSLCSGIRVWARVQYVGLRGLCSTGGHVLTYRLCLCKSYSFPICPHGDLGVCLP